MTATAPTSAATKTNAHTGQAEVCARRVSFEYWGFTSELTDDLKAELDRHAEERAKSCIVDGYTSGELNCFYVGTDEEIRGWWAIKS
jgi:hypothetical protein